MDIKDKFVKLIKLLDDKKEKTPGGHFEERKSRI